MDFKKIRIASNSAYEVIFTFSKKYNLDFDTSYINEVELRIPKEYETINNDDSLGYYDEDLFECDNSLAYFTLIENKSVILFTPYLVKRSLDFHKTLVNILIHEYFHSTQVTNWPTTNSLVEFLNKHSNDIFYKFLLYNNIIDGDLTQRKKYLVINYHNSKLNSVFLYDFFKLARLNNKKASIEETIVYPLSDLAKISHSNIKGSFYDDIELCKRKRNFPHFLYKCGLEVLKRGNIEFINWFLSSPKSGKQSDYFYEVFDKDYEEFLNNIYILYNYFLKMVRSESKESVDSNLFEKNKVLNDRTLELIRKRIH